MNQETYKPDRRTKEELLKEFEKLCRSYVPEWKCDLENPDIGTTLARIFSGQLSLNIDAFNSCIDRYHTEFVNLLDISLHKATPASAVVLLELLSDSVPGVFVEKKTRFMAQLEEGNCFFESDHPIFISSSKLDTVFMTEAEQGKIIPLKGSFVQRDYTGRKPSEEELTATDNELKEFTLFDTKGEGIERQALLMLHSKIFDVAEEELFCKIEGNDALIKDILNKKYRFLYFTAEGFKPVEQVRAKNDMLVLVKDNMGAKVIVEGEEYGVLVLEAAEPLHEAVTVSGISFSSNGRLRLPEYVGNGNTDYEVSGFNLFGDTLANYAECYIGMDSYFCKSSAKVSLSFSIGFKEHIVTFAGAEQTAEEEDLRVIKRRNRVRTSVPTVTYAGCDDISIEYYNGIGWKRLLCDQEYRGMFADGKGGNSELSFICPSDWEPTTVGAYQGRVLRITLQRSDNCYVQPCIHRYPVITNMTVQYSYEQKYEYPEMATSFFGTAYQKLELNGTSHNEIAVFNKGNYEGNALYLGFTEIFETGPVSLWWKLKDTHRDQNRRIHLYYSSPSGFKEMKFVDHTCGLSKTGTMLFLPPDDMIKTVLEDRTLCWLKLTDEEGSEYESVDIERIELNAVEVHNVLTHEEQSLFLDSVSANASFDLHAEKILDADVWVNEAGDISAEQMSKLMNTEPDRVRVNYNYLGEIDEFFVKWEERDNFTGSQPSDRHYCIDRINSRLIFGDGVKVRIPKNTSQTAVLVTVRSCDGALGNVDAGMINASDRNILYVGNISNPEAAYGGNDMETMAQAIQRGVNLLSSGGRFVTLSDYRDDILNYSEQINKASVVVGEDRYGNPDRERMHVLILMKDFLNGAASFYRMQSELKKHLLKHSELTIDEEELLVEEPVFVSFNVEVWAEVTNIDDSFEVRNQFIDALDEYLSPIGEGNHKGWDIGEIPKKTQIAMKLNALKSKAYIKQMMVTATYRDSEGLHEADISSLKPTPYMVAVSGTHRIHLSKSND